MSITTTIQPKDISLRKTFFGSIWRNRVTEAAAYSLVKLAKKNRSWRDFTKEEINKIAGEDFWFNYLVGGEYPSIIENVDIIVLEREPFMKNGCLYHEKVEEITTFFSFTDKFIEEVYRLSPQKN